MNNNNMADDNIVMALDLNQEPYVDPSPPSSPPTPDEPETSRFGIVDRIRQLQAVTARANQRQWWRRFMNKNNQGDNGVVNKERVRINCKRDISHLAKALEMDLDHGENKNDNGNFYDCNVCLGMAKDPILTSCGHLFCRSCFDRVPHVDSVSKECPTCQGEVTDANIITVHGNGKNSWWF